MPYSSYDHDKLETAETMRIERRIYFEAKDREIAPYASLPIAQLLSMRSESAAAEQAIFDDLKERAAAWEEQAGRTLCSTLLTSGRKANMTDIPAATGYIR